MGYQVGNSCHQTREAAENAYFSAVYAETSPFCFGIFAEAIPFRDKSEKNGGIKAV